MNLAGHCSGCGVDNQSCKIAKCSIEHGKIEYCFQCTSFPCDKYAHIDDFDSFITHHNQMNDMGKASQIGIPAYNAEQDRSTIEKTFMDLMNLAQSLSEEQQRYVREGFSSDEELSIYDLLFSENLSKSDIEKIKKVSVDLLSKIKERIAGMDHWTDKQETRAAVEVLIRDVLFEEIPDSMFNRLEAYRKAIFEHIYTHYKGVA